MENLEQNEIVETKKSPLHTITPLSKHLAMALFIILPFLGGWIGYTHAPEKVVEKERVIEKEVEVEKIVMPKIIVGNQTSDEDTSLGELEGYSEEYSTKATINLTLEKRCDYNPGCSFELLDTETGELVVDLQQAYTDQIDQARLTGQGLLLSANYISKDTGRLYFSTGVPESDACCNTVVYDVQTGLFDISFDHVFQHSSMIYTESGFLVFPEEDGSQITVYDLENNMEIVQEIAITDGTVIEEPCGMLSIGYNLTDGGNGRIIYGVHAEADNTTCNTRELVEYRAFKLPRR
jgi:hypothetical protein